jgi:adenylyltransferase/sulfurtransferase
MNNKISYERYSRQLILKDFGEEAQLKLFQAKVLVVGAGGLGCPALQYLVAAGVGTIGIADDDVVSLSNLHRQVLYTASDIGESKAEKAAAVLKQLNPEVEFHIYKTRLTNNNAADIVQSYDIVLDGSDNFPTRYLVNDVCVLLDKILVYGAVSQYEGQVAIFNCKLEEKIIPVNYRDLFPQPPAENEILNCAEAGVIGVLPGIIGAMMANETIKLITGTGKPLVDNLLTYDTRNNQLYEIALTARNETRSMIPENTAALKQMNYEWYCNTSSVAEISNDFFNELLEAADVVFIDVREKDESPFVNEFEHLKVPVSELDTCTYKINDPTVVVFCQTGKRSLQAAKQLSGIFGESKKVFSLKDGIVQWKQQQVKI